MAETTFWSASLVNLLGEALRQSLALAGFVCLRAAPVIFAVALLQEYGLLRHIDFLAKKVVSRTAFGPETGQAFIANAGSVYAGGGILVALYREGRISRANLVLSSIFSGFPGSVRVLFTSVGPVAFSLLTFPVALFYVCLYLLSATVNMLAAGALSHRLLRAEEVRAPLAEAEKTGNGRSLPETCRAPKDHRRAVAAALKQSLRYTGKMIVSLVVITAIVFACQEAGLFRKLPFGVAFLGLPDAGNAALFAYIGNAYAGMGILGELVRSGVLSTPAALKLLTFSMLCSRPIVTLLEAPAYYFGFYGLWNGQLIMLFSLSIFTVLATTVLVVMQALF